LLRSGVHPGQYRRGAVHVAQGLITALVVLLSVGGAALAQPAAGETRAELQQVLPQAQLVGKGRLSVWGFQVYDVRLWANPGFGAASFAAQPLALELAYLRDFDKQAVAERSIAEMRRSATISAEQAEKWMATMARVLPNVKKSDRVMGVHRPGVGASFWMNGKPLGEIRDAEFARLFFGIWLAPTTSEPGLRSALLAGASP
ncbi:MAG: chalcone isomerase family protein, partial [Pseudomonadota bacterium]|nr:chalcone isomerase family protein [Pseudomonadota bacterium]